MRFRASPTPSSFSAWVKANSDQIKIAFAVLAGLYAIFEYRSKDYLDRVKNATDVVERFLASDENKSLVALEDMWLSDDLNSQRKELETGAIRSQEFRHAVFRQVADKHRNDIAKSIRGLKAASICVMQGRCEHTTVCMHLAQRIQDFRCNFRETLADLSYAGGSCAIDEINNLADVYCGRWIGTYMGVKNYSGLTDNACLYDAVRKVSYLGKFCTESIIYKQSRSLLDLVWP